MPRPYAVSFTVSDALWMTTVGDETPLVRKRHRGRLRAYGRQVWAEAKEEGAGFTNRFVMLVTVGGRRESPVLSCETLKPSSTRAPTWDCGRMTIRRTGP